MQKVIRQLLCLALCCVCWACNSGRLGPLEYARYMETAQEEGYTKTIWVGKSRYVIQLATPEYLLVKELADKHGHIDSAAYYTRKKDMEDHIFFIIKLPAPTDKDPANTERMVMYYQQTAQADITLQYGSERLQPVAYNFENNYGLSPDNVLLAAFNVGKPPLQDMELNFNDKFNRTPMIKAGFSKEMLAQLPQLQIK